MSNFIIKNKIEVKPNNTLIVPGYEPLSAVTSITLEREWRGENTSYIALSTALEVIPGSTVEYIVNPKMRYFVLPSGPPPIGCPCTFGTDWYQILRDNAENTEEDAVSVGNGFITENVCIDEIVEVFPMEN